MNNLRLSLCLTIVLMLGVAGCVSKINGVDIGKGSGGIEMFMQPPTLRSHADRGNPHAQNNLGNMYRHGGGNLAFNELKAVRYLSLAARQGNSAALHNLGLMAERGKDSVSGSTHAQYSLGLIHLSGQGVTKDPREGVKWLIRAAEQGDQRAQYEVGRYLLLNRESTKPKAYALKMLRLAAENNYAQAQSVLGKTLFKNKRYTEAAKWLERAAEQGDADAQAALRNAEVQTVLKDARWRERRVNAIQKRAAWQQLQARTQLEEKKRRAKRLADAKLRDQKRKEAARQAQRLNQAAVDYLAKASKFFKDRDLPLAVWHATRCVNDWEELIAHYTVVLSQPENIKRCETKRSHYHNLDLELDFYKVPGAVLKKAPSRGVVPLLEDLTLCRAWETRSDKAVTTEVNKRGLRCAGMLRQANSLKKKSNEEAEKRRIKAETVRREQAERAAREQAARQQAARQRKIEAQMERLQREQAQQQALYNAQIQAYKRQLAEQERAREIDEGMALMGLGLGIMQGRSFGGGGGRGRSIQPPSMTRPRTTDFICVRRCLSNYGGNPSNSYVGMCQSRCTR
jgi:TPR repeat protein